MPLKDIELTTRRVNLIVVDTFLVIMKSESPFINIYNTNNHQLLGAIGTQGSGPNQFELPSLIKQISYDEENNSPLVTLYDVATRRVSKVNIFKAVNNESDAIQQELVREIEDVVILLSYKDDSLLLAVPESGGRFVRYDYITSKKTYIPYIPEYEVQVSDQAKMTIFASFIAVNKNKNKFVAAPRYLNELNFFDLQGNFLYSTIISPREKLPPPPGIKLLPPGIKAYFTIIEEVDDKIYTLKRGPDESKIQVFDWDGNPLEEYILKTPSRMSYFTYDKVHNQFYVYFLDEEPYNIYTYPLN